MKALFTLLTTCLFVMPIQAKYGGGSGTAQAPYQIATAVDPIALGETPPDCDEHSILTAGIDLDPNLPGHGVVKTVSAAGDSRRVQFQFTNVVQATPFRGVYDGRRQEGET